MQNSLLGVQMIYTNRKLVFKAALRLSNKGKAFYNSKVLPKISEAVNNTAEFFENLDDKKSLAMKTKYSVSYIDQMMKKRKIPYLKNGRSVRFIYSEVMAALKKESAV
jgi:excisionase family DNA binding protein